MVSENSCESLFEMVIREALLGMGVPFLNQVMLGMGTPVALQRRVTGVCSLVTYVVFEDATLGITISTNHI